MKCAAPMRQSIRELLDEEGGGDEPLAVGDPALGEQLPHRGVDERVAGAAFLPRGDAVGVVAPDPAARIHVAPLQFGRRREELGEEVAPAQLSEQRRRRRCALPRQARRIRSAGALRAARVRQTSGLPDSTGAGSGRARHARQ